MKNIFAVLLIIPMLILSSCSDESTGIEPVVQGTEITEFYFVRSSNPNLNGVQFTTIENGGACGKPEMGTTGE